jgi:hypothetical protein
MNLFSCKTVTMSALTRGGEMKSSMRAALNYYKA